MQKATYLKELTISATQKRNGSNNNKKDVMKIQSWLMLFSMWNVNSGTATGIDGDFGSATDLAVKNFQKAKGLTQNGIVDQGLFATLSEPIQKAFEGIAAANDLRKLIVNVANNHLKNHPFELLIKGESNTGPWVRAYMDGNEGTPWFWCMGFVQTIVDQAASLQGKNFKTIMPLTYSCDVVATTGSQNGNLIRSSRIRNNPALAKPGDIFLVQKSANDWIHTGIITAIGTDTLETIEGNTNNGGSSNGNAVLKRIRNFRQSNLDVFSIEELV